MLRLLFVGLIACSSAPSPAPVATSSRPATPIRNAASCAGVTSPTRVSIQRGRAAPFGARSIAARSSTTAQVYTFDITTNGHTETWLPESRETERYALVAGLCIRVIDGSTLDVAEPQAPEMPRCAIQCCETPESRQPAPDGTVECCFCE